LLPQGPINEQQPGFGLTRFDSGERLVGREHLTPRRILNALAPHLGATRLSLVRKVTVKQTTHLDYALYFGRYRIEGSQLKLAFHGKKLVSLRAELPNFRLPTAPP